MATLKSKILDDEEFLNSLRINERDNNNEIEDIGFNYSNDDFLQKQLRTHGNNNSRKAFALDDYHDLVDLVGTSKHKDIKMKQAYMSPKAFKLWQQNPKYPSRMSWNYEKTDLDNDGQSEFVIRDNHNNIIGVNGYYLAQSKYPERYAYQESVSRYNDGPRKGRPKATMNNWINSITGGPEAYDRTSLNVNYPEDIEQSTLYKQWAKYDKAEKKLPKKIRAYKHFTSLLFPTIIRGVREQMIKAVSEIMNNNTLNTRTIELSNLIKYPGTNAVQQARFYTAHCSYAWKKFIIIPILQLPKIKAEIETELQSIKMLRTQDKEFDRNHQNEDDVDLAIDRIKSRKWFKDVVDNVYVAIISDANTLTNLIKAIFNQFGNDYVSRTKKQLLLNEDKIYELNKKRRNNGHDSLQIKPFYTIDGEIELEEDYMSEWSSSMSPQISPNVSPIKETTTKPRKETPARKEKKEMKPKKTNLNQNIVINDYNESDDEKSEFNDNDNDDDY